MTGGEGVESSYNLRSTGQDGSQRDQTDTRNLLISREQLYSGLAQVGMGYRGAENPSRAPIAGRPKTSEAGAVGSRDFVQRQEMYAKIGRKQDLNRQRLGDRG